MLLVVTGAVVGAGLVIVKIVQAQGWGWRGFMDSNFHLHHSTIFGRFPEFAVGMLAAFVHRGTDLANILRGWRGTAATLACTFFYRVVEVPARRFIVERWAG